MDYPFGGGCSWAVINQFGGIKTCYHFREVSDGSITVGVYAIQLRRVNEEKRFELVKLDVRHEARMIQISTHGSFEFAHSRVRALGGVRLFTGWEIVGQRIQIKHGGEGSVTILIFLHPQQDVFSRPFVADKAAAMNDAAFPPRHDAPDIAPHGVRCKVRYDCPINERFFRLTLDDEVKADAHDGRPPMTFFSQSSESE
ncbi:MAG TPA: hypothetical protein PLU87_14235 [Sedimentisphaerales bacterium]|nr:hypothetical protein [Sedimentisphaerales bacterium]HRS12262.1 hypothetical protein [Sedimentisphaerales bacterium]HRV48851.1 hypothetical protein [Sedimentisphaerales bacterium]